MRLFALLSVQGTAMPETLLTETELNNAQARAIALDNAQDSGDWDGNNEFIDVSDNEFLQELAKEF